LENRPFTILEDSKQQPWIRKIAKTQRIEHVVDDAQPDAAADHLMRSKEDDLSALKCMLRHKLVATSPWQRPLAHPCMVTVRFFAVSIEFVSAALITKRSVADLI
jgi:hypothetical protein